MNSSSIDSEFEQSLARAQACLTQQDLPGFRAAVKDLQNLVKDQSGQWQSAVNFLARSVDSSPRPAGALTRPRPYRD
ncbi:MAG TPA: hypothetical protein VFG14_04805 [Chthoniobacteraceae bacterium]|jgi:hypothetical protein|nr:hypothetical protein [Chthoniobacteraceae bacterium]